MASCLLDKCCFFIDLKLGCLIIAYYKLITVIAVGIWFMIFAATFGYVSNNQKSTSAIYSFLQDDPNQTLPFPPITTEETANIIKGIFVVILVVYAIYIVISLAFVIILIIGLHKDIRMLIGVYLIYAVIIEIISIILWVGSIFMSVAVRILFMELLSLLLNMYFILVLRSYYYKMDESPSDT